ncbi:Hypothetical protein PHPALM_16956 [Phytophthora palmivora]|uniref:Uncharacterized protein n=1 Tax=Phytophthora palmivora TaxID=4796 RepID=A0A2P4XNG7_9STRA|nr:Hypothetical protein PHPALM_16956 [Phytophthora palmivora]
MCVQFLGSRSSEFDHPVTQPASLGNIMDDLKRGSTSKKSQDKESVDDFFAEFEEPNDYVFDPATGGYVASRVPPLATVTGHVSRSESTELLSPRTVPDKDFRKGSRGWDYNAPSVPISSSTDHKMDGNREVVEDQDEVAEIIVDKISSLESELAALKQLIRKRKGSGGSNKASVSHSATRRSVRKESIFDNDSSDEGDDGKPIDPYSSSIRPVSTSKRRPSSKKKQVKKRRDSFADLFEDSPTENETLGGATSYDALFQTGVNMAGEINAVDSDDDTELTPKRAKRRPKSRRRSSRSINNFGTTKEHSDSESEFTSLKGRRGKHTSRRKKNEEMDESTAKLGSSKTEDELVTPTLVDVIPVVKPVKKYPEEEDPIDALFDASNDRDVTKLYGEDDAHNGEHQNSAFETISEPIGKGNNALSSQPSSTSLTDETIPPSAKFVTSTNNSFSYSLDPLVLDKADEEDDFSINWTKMRKTKSRRHKARRNSSDLSKTVGESTNTTEHLALEPNLSDINSKLKVEVNDTSIKREKPETSVPNTFLADDASNWMSIGSLKEETMLTDDGDLEALLQVVGENKAIVITNDDKQEDKMETAATSVSMDSPIPIENVAPTSSLANAMSPGASVEHEEIQLSDVNIMEEPSGLVAKVNSSKEEDAAFDIFDKSGDMDFLPAITLTDLKTSTHEGDEGSSENDDEASLPGNDDAFTFEVQPPKKRPSEDVLTSISNTSRASERRQSSPPSPASSADENVEFGKYATTSVPSSSRTPSVDGSLDDPEDALVDDEPVLGKVESQAFDTDWQQMQAKEKERKKRLQVKQRQAQRDKVLRKQGVSSKSLASSAIQGSNKSKNSKKKKKDKDDTARSSSHHKKSGSSRKHRHREKEDADDNAGLTPTEPPRSLTEL